jgi:thiol-disulfide isomerase/thioredoxin
MAVPMVVFANNGVSTQAAAKAPQWLLPGGGKPGLHLRSGDTIPCEVIGIDEKGITLKSPISDTTFVPNEKIKSIELTTTWGSTQVDEVKRDRLLTLPRLQRDAPPTHLICSKNGDFLRGRILSMDETQLTVEVRLENRIIPRDRIAQIIWLHADELTGKPPASTVAESNQKTRVQTVRANGDRLTFVAEKADLKQISGTSDVLGPCHAALADVDQVLFGNTIEESAALLAYHLWKLHHAAEPKYVQAADAAGGGANGGVTGIESPLVGQPAKTFKLDMLDGAKFDLADRKGRIVVLDFWATWCGPCMQSMPMVDEVVREFADQRVDLVAVNMEEQASLIKSTLERNKLKVAVALDRDGAVAAKYAVTAIPQTVVIDREGKVVRLFVGGGKQTAEALRTAIKELIEGKPAGAAAAPK